MPSKAIISGGSLGFTQSLSSSRRSGGGGGGGSADPSIAILANMAALTPAVAFCGTASTMYTDRPPTILAEQDDQVRWIDNPGVANDFATLYSTKHAYKRPFGFETGIPVSYQSSMVTQNNTTTGGGFIKGLTRKLVTLMIRGNTAGNDPIRIGTYNLGTNAGLHVVSTTTSLVFKQGDGADYTSTFAAADEFKILQMIDNGTNTLVYFDGVLVKTSPRCTFATSDLYFIHAAHDVAALFMGDDDTARESQYSELDAYRTYLSNL